MECVFARQNRRGNARSEVEQEKARVRKRGEGVTVQEFVIAFICACGPVLFRRPAQWSGTAGDDVEHVRGNEGGMLCFTYVAGVVIDRREDLRLMRGARRWDMDVGTRRGVSASRHWQALVAG